MVFESALAALGVAAKPLPMEMEIITGTLCWAMRLSKDVNNKRSGPSAPTMNGAAVPGTYCRGT